MYSLSKPAARIGDKHECKDEVPGTPPVPHEGGPIITGCVRVLINGRPAARVGDFLICIGPLDTILEGSSTVLIGGKRAARFSDKCAHGGLIASGSDTVEIGDKMPEPELGVVEEEDEFPWPPEEERVKIITQALTDSIKMLEKRLELLNVNDDKTLKEFKMWFGNNDEETRKIIRRRIRRVLKAIKGLTMSNFGKINDLDDRKVAYGYVDPVDEFLIIYLGDKFWKTNPIGKNSKAGTIVHEISHFKKIGKTKDYAYGESCFYLGQDEPLEAVYNAESFEYFIEEVNILDYKFIKFKNK